MLSQNEKILKRIDEEFRMLGEKMDEGFRKMDRNLKFIALLILAETPEEKSNR